MNRIKELRKRCGLTLAQVAERANTSSGQIQRMESGARRVSTGWLERLAPILGVQPYEIIAPAIDVPLYGTVSAGGFKMVFVGEQPEDLPTVQAPPGLPKNGRNIALKVDGDSMNKVAPDGSIVFVNTNDKSLINGKFYVFRDHRNPEMAQFKMWQAGDPNFNEASLLLPFSTNSDHMPLTVTPETKLEVIGRAVMVVCEV